MFQPTNESYIRSVVETSIDRHMGESEIERVLRQGQSYQERPWLQQARQVLAAVGHLLRSIGKRVENTKAPEAVLSQRQIASR